MCAKAGIADTGQAASRSNDPAPSIHSGSPALIFSWDDGPKQDMRLAELLLRHGLSATFFVPVTNREGLATLDAGQLREVAGAGFEIGSHTRDHVYLNTCDLAVGREQILSGRYELEDMLGRRVDGFCYPGGKRPSGYREFLQSHGFLYARTIESFHLIPEQAAFDVPVTLQLYPHRQAVLIKGALSGRRSWERLKLAAALVRFGDLESRLSMLLDHCLAYGGHLHIWGHSWEFDDFDGWAVMERFCNRARLSGIRSLSVRQGVGWDLSDA